MELILREGQPADRQVCAQIFLAAQPPAYPRRPEARPETIDFEAETREEDVWVAEVAGRVRGLIAIYRPARFVHHLYVDRDYCRRGIGLALLSFAVRHCGGTGELKCDEANWVAQAFYLAAGWRPVDWGWAPSGPWIRFRH